MDKKLLIYILIVFLIIFTACNSEKQKYTEVEYNLDVEGGTIYGSLILPKGKGPFSIVVIHQGSGPTDRNGNSTIAGDNNSLKMLAEELGSAGIASVRYDKRGIAESMALVEKEEGLIFEDYIDDLNSWITLIRQDERFDKIHIVGHSEGALIGAKAALDSKVDGYISLAGVGFSAYDTLIRQLETQPKEITDISTPILEELYRGNLVENVPGEFYSLFRPSVQPYLISWFKYNPVDIIRELDIPILIIQGDNDIQVTVEDAYRLHDGAKDSKLIVINGMNHILKDAPMDRDGNLKTYNDPNLPINRQLITEIIEYIKMSKQL